MSTDKDALEMAQELAESNFEATIEDNAFVIRPAEAGIALLAAITNTNDQLQSAWESADKLASALEDARTANGIFRHELELVTEVLAIENYPQYVQRINNLLWAVVGVTEDGTEVAFEYNENQD